MRNTVRNVLEAIKGAGELIAALIAITLAALTFGLAGAIIALVIVVAVATLLYPGFTRNGPDPAPIVADDLANIQNPVRDLSAFKWVRVEYRCEVLDQDHCEQIHRIRATFRAAKSGQRHVFWALPTEGSIMVSDVRAVSRGHRIADSAPSEPPSCLVDLGRELTADEEVEFVLEVCVRDADGATGSHVRLPILEPTAILLIMVIFPNAVSPRRYYAHERPIVGALAEGATLTPRREDPSDSLVLTVEGAKAGYFYELSWSY
jgi:hypothetical protein